MTNSNSVSLTLPFAYGVRKGRITALAVPMAKRRKSGPGDLVGCANRLDGPQRMT
jgi:hypothetical protein